MKHLAKILAVGMAFAAYAPFAAAAPFAYGDIVVAGGGTFTFNTANTVATFAETSNGVAGANSVISATGAYTDFLNAPASSILFNNFSTSDPSGDSIFSITLSTGETLVFSETSFTGLTAPTGTAGGAVMINGTVTETGGTTAYAPTSGNLIFTENGRLVSFTEDALTAASPAPEPSSLILLGTGLVSAAGAALRKRRSL